MYVHPWLKPHQHNLYSAKSQKDSYQKIELFFLSPTVELLSPLLGFYMLFHWTRLLCRLLITFTMAWYFKARRGPAMPFIANTQIMVWNKLNLINSQIRPQVKNTGYLLGNIPLLWHDLLHSLQYAGSFKMTTVTAVRDIDAVWWTQCSTSQSRAFIIHYAIHHHPLNFGVMKI